MCEMGKPSEVHEMGDRRGRSRHGRKEAGRAEGLVCSIETREGMREGGVDVGVDMGVNMDVGVDVGVDVDAGGVEQQVAHGPPATTDRAPSCKAEGFLLARGAAVCSMRGLCWRVTCDTCHRCVERFFLLFIFICKP